MSVVVYEVTLHPSDYDGHEEDQRLGLYSTRERAEQDADLYVRAWKPAHTGCTCVWEPEIRTILLDAPLIRTTRSNPR